MSVDSLTFSEIERTPSSELIKGLINQAQDTIMDAPREIRDRNMTEKERAYQLDVLLKKRNTQYMALSNGMREAYSMIEQDASLKELENTRDSLDSHKDAFNEAQKDYHNQLQSLEEQEASYHWFDLRDQEY